MTDRISLRESSSRLGLHNNALGLRESTSQLGLHNNALGLSAFPLVRLASFQLP
jgi:hypothetical protein